MSNHDDLFTIDYFLNASECNAQRIIPLPLLVQRLLETATLHATSISAGPRQLQERGLAWVLSRLTMEMTRYPGMDSRFSISTWVDAINRHFTERCFRVTDSEGRVMGNVRTVWMAIDINERHGIDMTELMSHITPTPRECPVGRQSRIPAVTAPEMIRSHRFNYCDIDFNRHVNSTRYIETILNDRGVEFFDTHSIAKFEIAYMSETHYADTVEISRQSEGNTSTIEIARDGKPVTRARVTYTSAIA